MCFVISILIKPMNIHGEVIVLELVLAILDGVLIMLQYHQIYCDSLKIFSISKQFYDQITVR